MALTATITTNIAATLTGVATDLQSAPGSGLALTKSIALTTGVGLNQADKIYTDTLTLTTGQTVDLDVATGGGLTDALGVAVAWAKLKYIGVFAATANTTIVSLSRAAAGVAYFAAAADAVPIHPGGKIEIGNPSLAGYTVTAATADLVTLINAAGASATVDVVLIGTTT